MSSHNRIEELLRGRENCPTLDELSQLSEGHPESTQQAQWSNHLEKCPRCQAEVSLLSEFLEAQPAKGEVEQLRWVESEVTKRITHSVPEPAVALPQNSSHRHWLSIPRFVPGLAIAASVLFAAFILVAVMDSGPPEISVSKDTSGVYRTGAVSRLEPSGIVTAIPSKLGWEAYPGAAFYDVELMEVDQTVLLKVRVAETKLELPQQAGDFLGSRRPLYWKVEAVNSSGDVLASSESVEIRLVSEQSN